MDKKSKRILLKLSGNFFAGEQQHGLNFEAIKMIAQEIRSIHTEGYQIAVLTGGGNIFRGRSRPSSFDATAAHKIGCIATLPNALALTEILNTQGIDARMMNSFEVPVVARQFDAFRARSLLENGKIIVLSGGTGQPYFSTDTAAIIRSLEIKADLFLKGTHIDGVYSDDPKKVSSATRYNTLTYSEALAQKLGIMDHTAFVIALENNLNTLVFKFEKGGLRTVLNNPALGTLISST